MAAKSRFPSKKPQSRARPHRCGATARSDRPGARKARPRKTPAVTAWPMKGARHGGPRDWAALTEGLPT
jgi:hypothetical protein